MLVTGGRGYTDLEAVQEVTAFLHGFYGVDLRMLHGAARGADSLAQQVIEELGITFRKFPADWNGPCDTTCAKDHRRDQGKGSYCPAAGVRRNVQMADYLDFCRDRGHSTQVVAYPGGSGTIHMISEAVARNHTVDPIGWVPVGWDLPELP